MLCPPHSIGRREYGALSSSQHTRGTIALKVELLTFFFPQTAHRFEAFSTDMFAYAPLFARTQYCCTQRRYHRNITVAVAASQNAKKWKNGMEMKSLRQILSSPPLLRVSIVLPFVLSSAINTSSIINENTQKINVRGTIINNENQEASFSE